MARSFSAPLPPPPVVLKFGKTGLEKKGESVRFQDPDPLLHTHAGAYEHDTYE